jgi:adenylate kinase family enzyme
MVKSIVQVDSHTKIKIEHYCLIIMTKIIFITGFGGSGKSTRAYEIAKHITNAHVISLDKLQFGDGWVRRTGHEVYEMLYAAIDATYVQPNPTIILEGLYHDKTEGGMSIRHAIHTMLYSGSLNKVEIFKYPQSDLEHATRIMTRSFKRCKSQSYHESGNIEKPHNVARMMQKCFSDYDSTVQALDSLRYYVTDSTCELEMLDLPIIT